jgi:hypothetical protein
VHRAAGEAAAFENAEDEWKETGLVAYEPHKYESDKKGEATSLAF